MIPALLLLLAAQSPEVPTAPPSDWAPLPPLRYDRRPGSPPGLDEFARGEVAAGRCTPAHGASALRIDLAVLVTGGAAARIVPRAIGCATVEQFAAGLLTRLARDGLAQGVANGWYRATFDVTLPAGAPAAMAEPRTP